MKTIAFYSGGKDSAASIIIDHLNAHEITDVVFVKTMFDKEICAEYPEQMAFVESSLKIFRSWGYTTHILQSEKTFCDIFFRPRTRSRIPERNGKINGFPMAGRCEIQKACKTAPIKKFLRSLNEPYIQIVGIAADEKLRLEKMHKDTTKISVLEEYGYTEQMAKELAAEYGLLSPLYHLGIRRLGCWFCPNQGTQQISYLRSFHPELWQRLCELESIPDKVGEIWNTLNGKSLLRMD